MPIAWLYQTSFLWLSKTSAAGGFSIRTGSSGSVKTPANATAYGYKKIADYASGICKTAQINIGRDGLFSLLREHDLLIRKRKRKGRHYLFKALA
jgi:hypothetical protein